MSGFNYIDLDCDENSAPQTTVIDNDTIWLSICDGVTIRCGLTFSYWCDMIYSDTWDQWTCVGDCSDYEASSTPTSTPSQPPTTAPSNNPSSAPSNTPSSNPSLSPTTAPTTIPTAAPSLAPTRVPTDYEDYSIKISVKFKLCNITQHDTLSQLFFDFEENVYRRLKLLLEKQYFEMADGGWLEYFEFDIVFLWIANDEYNHTIDWQSFYTNVAYFNQDSDNTHGDNTDSSDDNQNDLMERRQLSILNLNIPLKLSAAIYCIDDGTADIIYKISEEEDFYEGVGEDLLHLFVNETEISFLVDLNSWSETDLTVTEGTDNKTFWEKLDTMYYILSGLCFILGLLTLLSTLHSERKCPKFCLHHVCVICKQVDGVKSKRIWIFGLQMWDLFSDVYFSYSLIKLSHSQNGENFVIFILSILSPLFIIIPYFANMFAATTLYKRHIVLNKVARLYFEQKLVFFCALVLLSGGVQPTVQLVSSKVFGMGLFDCGLSERELMQFIQIHFTHSVLLENFPQLMLQLVYIIEIGTIDEPVMFALAASFFSAMNAIFSYLFSQQMELSQLIVTLNVQFSFKSTRIFKGDVNNFTSRMGYRQALGRKMAEALGVSPKKIDVFSVIKTQSGCQIHLCYIMDSPQVSTKINASTLGPEAISSRHQPTFTQNPTHKAVSSATAFPQLGAVASISPRVGGATANIHGETPIMVIEKFIQATEQGAAKMNGSQQTITTTNHGAIEIHYGVEDSNGSAIANACKEVWRLKELPIVTVFVDDLFEYFSDSDSSLDSGDDHDAGLSELELNSNDKDNDEGMVTKTSKAKKTSKNPQLRREKSRRDNLARAETQLRLQLNMIGARHDGEQSQHKRRNAVLQFNGGMSRIGGIGIGQSRSAAVWKTKYKQLKKDYKQQRKMIYHPKLNSFMFAVGVRVDVNGETQVEYNETHNDSVIDDDDNDYKSKENDINIDTAGSQVIRIKPLSITKELEHDAINTERRPKRMSKGARIERQMSQIL